jgi:shikimate dehydrogenase
MISSRTTKETKLDHPQLRKVLLLGTDISRSISPLIQNVAFDKLGINARYELKELGRGELEEFISSISKSKDLLGFNVTSPFKEEIIRFLSSLDARSRSIGAVNTVSIGTTEGMRGFNTDYDGVVATLEKLGAIAASRTRNKAVVFGAGGASRACLFTLLEKGYASIRILNRTIKRAELISNQFKMKFPNSEIDALPFTRESVTRSLENCALVINAISNSNSKHFPVELDFSLIDKDTKFFDLGYKEDSLFLAGARRQGFQVMNGLLMLVVQAARSFEIWTGMKAPVELMMSTAKSALDKRY